jgi:3-oxoacyl-[acyl-carrier protein] reductase
MDLALRDKWALVTGSSAGIGEVIAHTLFREGAKVIVHGRDLRRAEAVALAMRNSGGTAVTSVGDLATDDGAARVAAEALAASGGIDILINNAGGYAARFWLQTTADNWRALYESDVPFSDPHDPGLRSPHARAKMGAHHQHWYWSGEYSRGCAG